MYDKIKVYTDIGNVDVDDNFKLRKTKVEGTDSENENRLLFITKSGKEEYGIEATNYFKRKKKKNNKDVVEDVEDEKTPFYISFKYGKLFVDYNPSNVFMSDNFKASNNENLRMCSKKLLIALNDIGINCNVHEFKLSRVDLCKNNYMEYPVYQYNKVFGMLRMKREKRQSNFPTSFTTMNNSREICLYDKIEEMFVKGHKPPSYALNRNVLRAELRLKKNEIVEHDLDVKKLSELYRLDVYDHVKVKYIDFLRENMFRKSKDNDDDRMVLDLNNEFKLMEELRRLHKRNVVYEYIQTFGIGNILEKYGSISGFKKFLEDCGFERTYIYRIGIDLERKAKLIKDVRNEVSIYELYKELERELLKVA